MIEESQGNIVSSDAEALVNTVNIVGIMGKGVALQFKIAFPDMFKEYQKAVRLGQIGIGKVQIYKHHSLSNPRYIINFPTKRHWREDSKIEYIQSGLKSLIEEVNNLKIRSIALPPLGCGMGNLNWDEVLPLIKEAFKELPDVKVIVFPPLQENIRINPIINTPRPIMNWARANIITIMGNYPVLGYQLTLLEVHKLLYFLQEAGEQSLRLRFRKDVYGPYAENLGHLLISFEGHYTQGLSEGLTKPDTPIILKSNVLKDAENFIEEDFKNHPESKELISKVLKLIHGFESPYGMELLSTAHWVIKHENQDPENIDNLISYTHKWNERKKRLMKPEHIKTAVEQLKNNKWI